MPSVAELQIVLTAKDDASRVIQGVGATAGGALKGLATIAAEAALALGAVGVAAGGLVAATGFGFNSMMENAQISFTTLTGSAEKAKSMLADLQEFARTSPFDTPGIIQASQRLMAMGFTADEVKPTLTALGNAMAAVGGSSDSFSRAAISIGQMAASANASSREMRELVMAGIPAWDILAEQMHKTVSDVQADFEAGEVSGKAASEMLLKGMEQRYTGMMDQLSRAGSGLLSNLKDTFAQLSGIVMEPLYNRVRDWMQKITDITGQPEFRDAAKEWGIKFNEALDTVIPKIQDFGLALFDIAQVVFPALWSAAQAAFPYIQELMGQLWEIAQAIGEVFANALPGIQAFFDAFGGDIWSGMMTGLSAVRVALEWLADNEEVVVAAGFGIAAAYTAQAIAATAAAIAAGAANAQFLLMVAVAAALALAAIEIYQNWDSISALFEDIAEKAQTLGVAIKDWLGTAWSESRDKIIEWANSIVNAFEEVGESLAYVWDEIFDPESGANDAVENFFSGMKDTILGVFSDAGDWLVGVGEDLVAGLRKGIEEEAEDFGQWWRDDFAGGIIGAAMDAFGIGSPSTVFAEQIGQPIGEGIAQGIESTGDVVAAAVQTVTNTAIASGTRQIEEWMTGIERAAQSHVKNVWGAMNAWLENHGLEALPGTTAPGSGNPLFSAFDYEMESGAWDTIIGGVPTGKKPRATGGGGGGGGGGSAKEKEAAVSAADQFAADFADALQMQDWEAKFGDVGASIMEAFTNVITSDEKGAASAAHGLIQAMQSAIDQAVQDEIPGARELGNSFMEQMLQAIKDKSPEQAAAIADAMNQAFNPAAVGLTMDSWAAAIKGSLDEANIEKSLGSAGVRMMEAFDKAIKEGGAKNVKALADMATNMKNTLMDKLPAAQGAYLATGLVDAFNNAIRDKSPESEQALRDYLATINSVLDGGAIDIRTGIVYLSDQVEGVAKMTGVAVQDVINNIGFFVDSGLMNWIGKFDQLPEATQKAINAIAQKLAEAKISIGQASAEIAAMLAGLQPIGGGSGLGPGGPAGGGAGTGAQIPPSGPIGVQGPTIPGVRGYNIVWEPGVGWRYVPAISSYAADPAAINPLTGAPYGTGIGWGVDPSTGQPYGPPGSPTAPPDSRTKNQQPIVIPEIASGGSIEETGIAVVHAGETVIPADIMHEWAIRAKYGYGGNEGTFREKPWGQIQDKPFGPLYADAWYGGGGSGYGSMVGNSMITDYSNVRAAGGVTIYQFYGDGYGLSISELTQRVKEEMERTL